MVETTYSHWLNGTINAAIDTWREKEIPSYIILGSRKVREGRQSGRGGGGVSVASYWFDCYGGVLQYAAIPAIACG